MKGKYVVVCTKPHAEWTLAQLPGARGKPIVMHHDRVYTSLDDAERAIFKLRWEAATGEKLADGAVRTALQPFALALPIWAMSVICLLVFETAGCTIII